MGERLERQGMEDGLQRVNRLDQPLCGICFLAARL